MNIYDRGIRLKELRERKKLTQADVARKLGVSRTTIHGYEQNTKAPRIDNLIALTLLYDTSVDYILGIDNRDCIYLDSFTKKQRTIMIDFINNLKDNL